ncbi:MAG: hypothetical protein ABW199_06870 [Caulobacterales bacterium]
MTRMASNFTELVERAREDARLARKKRYRNMIGIALGAVGVALAIAGMPIILSIMMWAFGFLSWMILKAV